MSESASTVRPSNSVLRFEEAKSPVMWVLAIFSLAIAAFAATAAPASSAAPDNGVAIGGFVGAIICFLAASRRWIADFDIKARRFRLSRRLFGLWTRTVADCPFDQCRHVGRIEFEHEGGLTYWVYIELADGTRHNIPLKRPTFVEAGRVATDLSETTRISRFDTKV